MLVKSSIYVSLLMICCCWIFIIVPATITLAQLHKAIKKWKRVSDDLNVWISENVTILYMMSMISGSSFSAVGLCNSNLFNLEKFDMGLSRTQIMSFGAKRIYSTVLMEVE